MKSIANIKIKVAEQCRFRHLQEDIDYLKNKLAKISSEPSTVRDELLRGAYVDLENAITKLQKLENHINQGTFKSWIAESGNSIK